jgi:SAM-dependent methyltransferase
VVLLTAVQLLRKGPLSVCDLTTRNASDAASQAHFFEARARPTGARRVPPVRYAVADATALPFADRSWPLVVSAYFTDVLPLSRLLPELWRVLAPGGRFVHVGPLGYHFDDLAEHLPADELVDAFRFAGFEVGPRRWMTSTHHRLPGSLFTGSFENLVFTARRPTDGSGGGTGEDAHEAGPGSHGGAGPGEAEGAGLLVDAQDREERSAGREGCA